MDVTMGRNVNANQSLCRYPLVIGLAIPSALPMVDFYYPTTSLIVRLLPSGVVAPLGNKRTINDVIMTSLSHDVTVKSFPLYHICFM